MAIQVCYFKDFSDEKIIIEALSSIYLLDKHLISMFGKETNCSILNFEFTKYNFEGDFNIQLEIFLEEETILRSEVYNNLILAVKLVDLLKLDILINDESDDPYQWLFLNRYKRLFLVEQSSLDEIDGGINIIDFKGTLDLIKAINFLPQKDDINHNESNKAYLISNSKKWLSIIR